MARSIFILKVLVTVSLVITAFICGVGSYYIIQTILVQRQRSEFTAVAQQFHENLFVSVVKIENSLNSIADFVGMYCPERSQWPLCPLPSSSYNEITTPLVKMANGRAIGFAPIIKPSEIPAFENMTYGLYESEGYTEVGHSSFGKGIYFIRNDTRYRALNMTAGRKQILAPIQLIANLTDNLAAPMFDLHSTEIRAEAIEGVMDCFEESGRRETCILVTDIIHLVQDTAFRPAVLIVYPVNPANAPSEIVAFTYFVVNWDTLLLQALPSYIDSMDAVLTNDRGQAFSFRVSNGVVQYRGRGNHHDERYSDLKSTYDIISSRYSIQYSVALYPTHTFMTQYSTVNPIVTSVVSFSVVLLTSIIFFVYDRFMNQDADEKALVNNTKRLFVRFISHEIRTPLNTVHLGIKLFIQEISVLLREINNAPSLSPNFVPMKPTAADRKKCVDIPKEQLCEEEKKTEAAPQAISEVARKLNEWVELTKDIESSSDAAILVLNDLINYDKISIGGLQLEISEVNLWTITQRTVAALELQGRQGNISLSLDMELTRSAAATNLEVLTRLCVLGDEIKLSQVVRNLVSNALKFTPYGGSVAVSLYYDDLPQELPVESSGTQLSDCCNQRFFSISSASRAAQYHPPSTSLEAATGSLVFVVRDTGAGISKENLEHLFEEGVQFHADLLQAGGGSGLGLWISKGIVEMHGGTLTGHSDGAGRGSVFTFRLPAYLNTSANYISTNVSLIQQYQLRSQPPSQCCTKFTTSTVDVTDDVLHLSSVFASLQISRVLVVDDAASSRKIVCRLLRMTGCEFVEAANGQECINKFQDPVLFPSPPDLILVDYEMPIMNGPTAVKELRALGCRVPIIGLTGNVLPEDVELFISHGADAVLGKPLTITRLADCLAGLPSPHAPSTHNSSINRSSYPGG